LDVSKYYTSDMIRLLVNRFSHLKTWMKCPQ
jgi:hypothetical protein